MAQIAPVPGSGGLVFDVRQREPTDFDFDLLEGGGTEQQQRRAFDELRGVGDYPALQRAPQPPQPQRGEDYVFDGPRPMQGVEREQGAGGGGQELPAEALPPEVADFYQELGAAQLVDPAESVLTFAGLLADSLDSSAAGLIDPATGLFKPRVQGLLEKARREIVSLTGNARITVQALIYDNPDNDSARILFSEVIKYRVLREAAGGAFPKNIYERRTLGADGAGNMSLTGGYRLATNQHQRRFNLRAWRLTLDKFRNVIWVRNPLLRRYRAIRAGALARILSYEGQGTPQEVRRLRAMERQARRGAAQSFAAEDESEEEERVLDELEQEFDPNASEEEEGGPSQLESTPFDALIGLRRGRAAVSQAVSIRSRRLLQVARLAREGRDAVLRAMPYVLEMGFSEDYYETPGYY